jgi:PKD repeat protein
MWLALAPMNPFAGVALAAPNDTISGLVAANDSPKLVSEPVSFTASVTEGTGISYTWDFGDGNSGTGITTTHAYTAAGVYTATVVASNTTDIVSTTTSVTILEAILGLAATNDSPKEINAPVSFTASVTSGTSISYTWDFGDGSNGTGITTTHAYTAPGLYTATVLAENALQNATVTTTVEISAPIPISGLVATNNGPKEVDAPVSFTASVTSGAVSTYTWNFGDGGTGTGITTTHSYTQSGLYTATVVASDGASSVTATTQVEVADAIVDVRDFVYDPTPITVPVGGKVIWILQQGTHSVTSDDNGTTFNQPAGNDWGSFSHDFPAAAALNDFTIGYHCTVHAGMTGQVIIDTPIFTLNFPNIRLRD